MPIHNLKINSVNTNHNIIISTTQLAESIIPLESLYNIQQSRQHSLTDTTNMLTTTLSLSHMQHDNSDLCTKLTQNYKASI